MSIEKAIVEAQEFIELAEKFRDEYSDLINKDQVYNTYQMKSRAKMKRQSMRLSEALVELRKLGAYS